jgi:hypothetical protein
MAYADLQLADAIPDSPTNPSVLLIFTDPQLRRELADVCRSAGVSVFAVGSIAEIERWPVGGIVITDLAHVTPWWKAVGAMHVLALVDDVDAGEKALREGASGWLLRKDSRNEVTALALTFTATAPAEKPS